MKELEMENEERRKELADCHRRERVEHSARWQSPQKVRMYNRPSHGVLQLRRKEELLTAQCRFAEADEVSKILKEEMAKQEEERARIRQKDYEESLAKLEARQLAEIQWFDENAEIERERMRQKAARAKELVKVHTDFGSNKSEAAVPFILPVLKMGDGTSVQTPNARMSGRER
jgi:hypothetical protein